MKPKRISSIFIWIFIGVGFLVLLSIRNKTPSDENVSYSGFKALVEQGKVSEVVIFPENNSLVATKADKKKFTIDFPEDAGLIAFLEKHKVEIKVYPKESSSGFFGVILKLLPLVLILLLIVFMSKTASGPMSQLSRFGSSKAKIFTENGRVKTTFADVAGIEEVKEELQEIIDFLKNPQKYRALGGKIPRGVLLAGPPGTGKTLLARAIAGEAGVAFLYTSGSAFLEMFVGVGASRVRSMFEEAKKSAPCIVFIDEIDAVGKSRGISLTGSHEERDQTLNQLLTEMDGFEQQSGVIVVAATNRPDVLDPALRRPGRFDRVILVPLPDSEERLAILEVHTRNKPLADDVNLRGIAKSTPGFSGADLENLANEAALLAARYGKEKIGAVEFDAARDKVTMGLKRKNNALTPRDKEITKYHESGHAIVALCNPKASNPHKVTIIPRGMAGGFTEQLNEERMYMEYEGARAQIQVMLGGRIAEEMFCNTATSGASNDLQRASELARKMILKWGMGDVVGRVTYEKDNSMNLLGLNNNPENEALSEETRRAIDNEVRKLIGDCYSEARKILDENREKVGRLAKLLDERETVILTDEVIKEINGEA